MYLRYVQDTEYWSGPCFSMQVEQFPGDTHGNSHMCDVGTHFTDALWHAVQIL